MFLWSDHIDGVMVSVLECGRIKPKIIILEFVTSPLNTQH